MYKNIDFTTFSEESTQILQQNYDQKLKSVNHKLIKLN